jgi:hypothetical protein
MAAESPRWHREVREADEAWFRRFCLRSLVLRQRREAALVRAAAGMRGMAEAWHASGLPACRPLPEWLAAALDDVSPVGRQ